MPGDKPLVYVLGDCILDHQRFVIYSRPSPEDPCCPVGTDERSEWVLGGAANVARWISGLGEVSQTVLVAHFSHADVRVDHLLKCLSRADVTPCCYLERGEGALTVKERLYLWDGDLEDPSVSWRQVLRIDSDTDVELSQKEAEELCAYFSARINQPAVIVIADYGKGVFTGDYWPTLLQNLGEYAEAHRIPTIVNSKYPFRWSRWPADFLVCNDAEMRTLQGRPTDARHVITTHAAQGVTAHVNRGPWSAVQVHEPTQAREVRDVTGAGDAFLAGLASHLVMTGFRRGQELTAEELRAAISAGQRAAALCVSQMGCGSPIHLEAKG